MVVSIISFKFLIVRRSFLLEQITSVQITPEHPLNFGIPNIQVPSNASSGVQVPVDTPNSKCMPTLNEVPIDETFVETNPAFEILQFPISSIPVFDRNEELLDDTVFEAAREIALVSHSNNVNKLKIARSDHCWFIYLFFYIPFSNSSVYLPRIFEN